MSFSRTFASLAIAAVLLSAAAGSLRSSPTAAPRAMRADTVTSSDPIARLQARLDAGETLPHDSVLGYLPGLLQALKIPVSSQGLVFSRTSLQTELIGTWSPRALYFNDDVYIGYVQGSEFLEIASVSPIAGAIFYTMQQEAVARPSFKHETTTCLMCHQSRATGDIPSFLMLSTIADRLGYPIANVYSGPTTDRTPIPQRFGGWYVTGTLGKMVHSGNVYSPKDFHQVDKDQYRNQIDLTVESALTTLNGKFDATPYLTGHSDIVALMVLVHQTSVHNLITAAHEAAKKALVEQSALDRYQHDSTASLPLAVSSPRLQGAVERLVRALLFVDEAPLDGPIQGTTSFAADFSQQGPRDKQGRSLRDFDLQQRLFKYPLSFLIYSEGFDAMPVVAKDGVYARLRTILNGKDPSPEFTRITANDRKAILEILNATKPDFAKSAAH
jgi:hypothetical protein